MSSNSHTTEHVMDGLKAAPAVGFWTTWFWGVNWTVIGAFLMAIYTVLLILDKLGVLTPARVAVVNAWKAMWRARVD